MGSLVAGWIFLTFSVMCPVQDGEMFSDRVHQEPGYSSQGKVLAYNSEAECNAALKPRWENTEAGEAVSRCFLVDDHRKRNQAMSQGQELFALLIQSCPPGYEGMPEHIGPKPY